MCNEYVVRFVEGEWKWVALAIGGGGQVVGDFDREHPEEVIGPSELALEQHVWSGYPDREMPVAVKGPGGGLRLEIMRWGFPSPQAGGRPVTNARNLNSSYWRAWLKPEWRCLVPVTEFCEWTDTIPKQKKWFKLKNDTPFMFAGIWRSWTGIRGTKAKPVEGEHKLFAFVTTEPNSVVSAVHAKAQPVILTRNQWLDWMTAPVEIAMELIKPSDPSEMMEPYDNPTK